MRVLIADDHVLFRDGLRSLLRTEHIDVVAEADNGREAVELARVHRPDIALLDLNMPQMSGLEAAKAITGELPEIRVVVLTASDDDADLIEAIKSGAQGYLLKNLRSEQLFEMMRGVLNGEPALTSGLAYKLLKEFGQPQEVEQPHLQTLTKREQEILNLMVQGITSTRDLADRLIVSEHTVKYHLRNILAKLHLKNRAQVVAYAAQHNPSRDAV
ncbi:MAG: response regulator transcription factor [Chloroflexota bacterium]|nr:response regulator transcription factor [Chloroflexota bacterium]